ncbi:MAG: serine/threonine-protein phosphatase [Ruminococcaceae bacterium]|nr:serine/threonine-protein phosphatase [Oscillospiraceae bacterium]
MFFYGESDIGAVRHENQDCFCLTQIGEDCFIGAVLDGMGGLEAGSHASELARDTFTKYVVKNLEKYKKSTGKIALHDDTVVKNILCEGVARANHALYMESITLHSRSGMGTTLASILVIGKKAYICHIGDSRVYGLISGKLSRLTKDHSLVQYLLDSEQISPSEADGHPQKNVLLKAIGTEETVSPDISVMTFAKAKHYLICSDGLTLHISDGEIEKILLAETAAQDKVKELISLARARGERDNTTVLIITP